MTIKGLSLTQPWATLVALGQKKYETRSWRSTYEGWLAIHAAKGFPKGAQELCYEEPFASSLAIGGYDCLGVKDTPGTLPRSAIVAVCRVTHYQSTDEPPGDWLTDREIAFGDYSPGRWAWRLEEVMALPEPIPCKGALSLWTLPPDVLEEVRRQWLVAKGRQLTEGARRAGFEHLTIEAV